MWQLLSLVFDCRFCKVLTIWLVFFMHLRETENNHTKVELKLVQNRCYHRRRLSGLYLWIAVWTCDKWLGSSLSVIDWRIHLVVQVLFFVEYTLLLSQESLIWCWIDRYWQSVGIWNKQLVLWFWTLVFLVGRAPGCQREYESRAAVNTVVLHPNQVSSTLLWSSYHAGFGVKVIWIGN